MTDSPTIVITHEGTTYRMQLSGFTGADELAIWRATGVASIPALLRVATPPPVWVWAALVWRWRVTNGGEKSLTYDEVVASMSYDSVDLGADQAGEPYPEA